MPTSSLSITTRCSIRFFTMGFITIALVGGLSSASESQPEHGGKDQPAPTKSLKINLDKAIGVQLPALARNLKPLSFRTSDGKGGWVIRIPGTHPIATPAYADGLLFVGGGYGSHEFYAFNAKTGEVAWKISTSDDGPTVGSLRPAMSLSTPKVAL